MGTLKDKVAIVTGAGRQGGLGQAIARALAQAGAHVALTDLGAPKGDYLTAEHIGTMEELESIAEDLREIGPKIVTMACDVTDEDQVRETIAATVDQLGRLDIVVNNAGLGYIMKPVTEYSAEEWDLIQAVNMRGPFLFTKHGGRQMIEQGDGGRIINIASQAAKSGFADASAYTASKHGLLGLTRSAAIDLGKHAITVNAVCPNHVTTGLGARQNEFRSKVKGISVDDLQRERRAKIPAGRIGLPEDTAGVCVFLASNEASYITGEGLNVSGGEEMH